MRPRAVDDSYYFTIAGTAHFGLRAYVRVCLFLYLSLLHEQQPHSLYT